MQPNMSEQSTKKGSDNDKLPPPTRGQRLAAFAFLGAFGLTILTVLLTGLSVGAPSARHLFQPAPPAADSAPAKAESDAGSPSAKAASSPAATSPEAPAPAAADSSTNENASTDDAARDRDDAGRKDGRRHADDARADDSR
jgi:hypothetical protein